ncbi:MAG TPA: hypothetical protein VGP41_15200 [Candidatus Lustribacter sp.]|jgi:hypothetical protein|nr:hypothetical protein [Candidatus Lustribacter sp.]
MILFKPGHAHFEAIEAFVDAVEAAVHLVLHRIETSIDRIEAFIDAGEPAGGCVSEHEKGRHDVVGRVVAHAGILYARCFREISA